MHLGRFLHFSQKVVGVTLNGEHNFGLYKIVTKIIDHYKAIPPPFFLCFSFKAKLKKASSSAPPNAFNFFSELVRKYKVFLPEEKLP